MALKHPHKQYIVVGRYFTCHRFPESNTPPSPCGRRLHLAGQVLPARSAARHRPPIRIRARNQEIYPSVVRPRSRGVVSWHQHIHHRATRHTARARIPERPPPPHDGRASHGRRRTKAWPRNRTATTATRGVWLGCRRIAPKPF